MKKKINSFKILLIVLITIVLLISIISVFNKKIDYKIIVDETNVTIKDTDTYQINAKVEPKNDKYYVNKYVVNNPLVATVNENGLVTPITDGTVTVLIYSNNNLDCSVLINIEKTKFYPTSIKFDKNNIELKINEEYEFNYTIEPSNCNLSDIQIESSNQNVIIVEGKKIKAIGNGEAFVTIKTINNLTDTIHVKVNNLIEKIEFLNKNYNLEVTDTSKLEYKISPDNEVNIDVTFTSSDNSIVSVDQNGIITANKKGNCKIYVKTPNNKQNEVNVSVKENLIKMFPNLNKIKDNYDKNINPNSNLEYKDKSIILYGSDFQGTNREKNIKAILTNINNNNIKADLMGFVGDYYTNGLNNNTSQIENLSNIVHKYSNLNKTITFFTSGNHDKLDTKHLINTGGYISNNYAIYPINFYDYKWNSSTCSDDNKTRMETLANNLEKFLKTLKDKNVKSPVIVSSHIPLHKSDRNDTHCAGYIFDLLNEYGKSLNIIFLFGHNHSGSYDNCIGGSINNILKGTNIYTYDKSGSIVLQKLNFTYLNAGYIGSNASKNGTLKCNNETVTSTNVLSIGYLEITNDNLLIKRYTNSKVYQVTNINLN